MKSTHIASSADIEEILCDEQELAAIAERLGTQITEHYRPFIENGELLLVVGILKGSILFLSDLVRQIKLPMQLSFLQASSYGNGMHSSGVIEIRQAPDDRLLKGAHVLLVEDILDTGNTLHKVLSLLSDKGAKSVKLCALLDKPSRRQAPISADFCGKEIEDRFAVGYGLDYAELYRNLPYVGVLKPEIYQ